ncbi:MAG: PIG-L deacetylase family protein [Candidatus Methylomirabilales bacterium]
MRTLVLSAHADDAQVALGGTIVRLSEEESHEIYYVGLSICEESVPKGFPPDILDLESRKVCAELAIPANNVELRRYKVRHFPSMRQEILDDLIELKGRINPEIVFIPSTSDVHQDHAVLASEAIRAFRRQCSLYGYDFPWNVLQAGTLNLFVELTEGHLTRKIMALRNLKSQLEKENNCLTEEYLRSLAVERGNRIGARFAEALEVIREVKRVAHGLF